MEYIDKLKMAFKNTVVYKSPRQTSFFKDLGLPSYLRDWVVKKYSDENGMIDMEMVSSKIKSILPRKEDWVAIKDYLINEGGTKKFIAKISVDVDIRTDLITFSLPDFGLFNSDTIIEKYIWDKYKTQLISNRNDVWGIIELQYVKIPIGKKLEVGKISLLSFQSFNPYRVDLEYYYSARSQFTTEEWINVLLGAIDYNPEGFKSKNEKLSLLTRLLPFVEKRLNLIELAPKGTGKSYVFSNISKTGWLISGGTISRAKMFYDISRRQFGLVTNYDFIAMDEVQTIDFPDVNEMRGALKGYLESGRFTVANMEGVGESGIILLGNISEHNMNVDINMFTELPELFNESALIDRFHGFVKGWEMPRLSESMVANGWALNTEYFSEVMHILRNEIQYRDIVEELLEIPVNADKRDTEAIKRICTAWLKLLFPHVKRASDIDINEFRLYCLKPALNMRSIIKTQLGIIDTEFFGKLIPAITIKDKYLDGVNDEN